VLTNLLKHHFGRAEIPIPNDTLIRAGLDESYFAGARDAEDNNREGVEEPEMGGSRHVNPLFRRQTDQENRDEMVAANAVRGDIAVRMWTSYCAVRDSRRRIRS
jgi:hypothetical protein